MAGRDPRHQSEVSEKMKQIVDQSSHFLLGLIILLPLAVVPGIITFALAGLCLGIIREATEKSPITSKGSLLDMLFWLLGGLAAGAIHHAY